MNLLIFYIVLAIGVSFICSILEAVVLSISPNYLQSLKTTDNDLFKKVYPLRANIEKPLASILTINTFAHTAGAAGAGAQALAVYGEEWIAVFSFILTLAILFFSEIIPKSVGAQYWKSLLRPCAAILPFMIYATYPLVYASQLISKLLDKQPTKTSREEIKAIVDIGLKDGAIEENEYSILRKALDFKDKTALSVITKTDDVTGLGLFLGQEELREKVLNITYSRLPVFGVTNEDVKGYVLRSDLLSLLATDDEIRLSQIYKPMLIVSSDMKLKQLFVKLLERREHMCSVINIDGDFLGIVTLEDLLEEMLGLDIIDEFDP